MARRAQRADAALNFEFAALLYSEAMNHFLREAFERDLRARARSRPISLDDVEGLPWPKRLDQAGASLLSPLQSEPVV